MILSRLFEAFINVVLPTLAIAGVGYIGRRRLHLDLRAFTRLSLYILAPCLIFSSLIRANVSSSEGISLTLFTVILIAGLIVIGLLLSLLLRYDATSRNALLITATFGNTGNFGLAMSLFAFGQVGLDRSVIIFVAHSVLMNTIAVYLASRAQLKTAEAVRTVIKMPVVWAAVGAIIVLILGIQVPEAVFKPVESLGTAAVPIMLLALGIQLANTGRIEESAKVGVALGTRLLVSPLLGIVIVPLLGLSGISAKVAILMAAMPTAVTMVVLAVEFAAKPRFVASVVVTTTLASVVTISGLLIWLM